nr:hypothetical protein [Tanacetum cinerariifolium]
LRGDEDPLSAKHQLAVKGLFKCKASERNIRRIQVKDIVKDVKDYLKIYSSAEMDIRSAVSISCPAKFACKLDTLSKQCRVTKPLGNCSLFKTTQDSIMSRTIPPIPPPLGTNIGSPSNPNVNRVDTMPNIDTTNISPIINVSRSVVDDDLLLHQLFDSRGGSHITNVPIFDKDDFTSWKIRFLVFLDGLEPYLITTLEDGPFVPMLNLSTPANPLPKRQNQWSNAESRLANQYKRLKTIIIGCQPNDVMKSIVKCKTAKEMWNDLILAHEGPSDTMDTKMAALRLKFNAFKALEGEKGSNLDVEEDNKTSNEFMANLKAEYHERALLANQKRYYKMSGRVGSARKPMDKSKETCFAYGKPGHF